MPCAHYPSYCNQPSKGMNLNRAHQKDSTVGTPGNRCWQCVWTFFVYVSNGLMSLTECFSIRTSTCPSCNDHVKDVLQCFCSLIIHAPQIHEVTEVGTLWPCERWSPMSRRTGRFTPWRCAQGGVQAKSPAWGSVWDQESQCTAGLYLAQPCVGSCDVRPYVCCPSHFKLSQLGAFLGDRLEWSTPRRFLCSHIWEQMPDNVRENLLFTFILVFFLVEHSSTILFT